jgi:hypothetical protein
MAAVAEARVAVVARVIVLGIRPSTRTPGRAVLRVFEHAYGRAPEQVEDVALPEGWQGDRESLLGTLKILAANGADDFHLKWRVRRRRPRAARSAATCPDIGLVRRSERRIRDGG